MGVTDLADSSTTYPVSPAEHTTKLDRNLDVAYQFDAAGNLKKKTQVVVYNVGGSTTYITRYFYDDANRLEYVDYDWTTTKNVHYVYGPTGERVEIQYGQITLSGEDFSSFSASTSRGFVCMGGVVLEEWTVSSGSLGTLKYRYVRNPATDLGGGINSIVYQIDGTDYRYYHYNHKGDTGALTAENKDIIAWYEYDAWGAITTKWEASGIENEFRFSTKQWDATPAGPPDAGLIYFGARYLSTNLGRWTQLDPAGTVDRLNMYAFISSKPIDQVDPFGLRQCTTKRLRTPWKQVAVVFGPEGCPSANVVSWWYRNLGKGWHARYAGKRVGLGWPDNIVGTILFDGFEMDPLKYYTGTLTASERYESEERYDKSCKSCCRYWYRKQYKAEFTDFALYKIHGGKDPRDTTVTHLGGNAWMPGECAPENADYSDVEDFPTADLYTSNISQRDARLLLQYYR